jgi:dTDP-glucose 4,6-dehydratase
MNPTNVLVTGGAGFIGSNFVRHLLRTEPGLRVFNLDALTYAGSLENLKNLPDMEMRARKADASSSHTFIKGNISNRELVAGLLKTHRIDTIVHFAAETHVDRSIAEPDLFVKTNVLGTQILLETAWQYWGVERALKGHDTRFHHISTDEVFGSLGPDENAWTEDAPYAPHSPYAASKASSDHLVRAYGHTYGLPFTITNCSNNYGPYQFPEKFIPLMISNALTGKSLPIYGDGKQVRDWLHVDDHCEAIATVVRNGRPGETYNVGGGVQPTNLEIVEMLCSTLDEALPNSKYVPHRSLIEFVADRPGHDRRYAIDCAKIRTELGWRPRHTLQEGLKMTIAWYLTNQEWITAIQSKGNYRDWIVRNYRGRSGRQGDTA